MKILDYKSEVTVIWFRDRLDSSHVGEIREELKELTRSGHNQFVVNLRNVSCIDSQGPSILVSL